MRSLKKCAGDIAVRLHVYRDIAVARWSHAAGVSVPTMQPSQKSHLPFHHPSLIPLHKRLVRFLRVGFGNAPVVPVKLALAIAAIHCNLTILRHENVGVQCVVTRGAF